VHITHARRAACIPHTHHQKKKKKKKKTFLTGTHTTMTTHRHRTPAPTTPGGGTTERVGEATTARPPFDSESCFSSKTNARVAAIAPHVALGISMTLS
jgi:hypothetical protein